MKSHRNVAGDFASGSTKSKGSRMFIEGDTVFSYARHFPIAKRYFKHGIEYLFNSRGYSSSTASHKSYVLNEILGVVLHIKDCDIDKTTEQYNSNINEISELQGKIERARKEHKREEYTNRIKWLLEQNELLEKVRALT